MTDFTGGNSVVVSIKFVKKKKERYSTFKKTMNSKADLKAAREAIGAKKFTDAVKACKRVLLWEGENYNA